METIPITFVYTNFKEPKKSIRQTCHWLAVPSKGDKVVLHPDGYDQPVAFIVESLTYSDRRVGRLSVLITLCWLSSEGEDAQS